MNGEGQTKMSGLACVGARDAYVSNRRLLAGKSGLVFRQARRKNCLLNREVTEKLICHSRGGRRGSGSGGSGKGLGAARPAGNNHNNASN